MKKQIKNSLIAILFSASLFTSAFGSSPYVKVETYDTKKFVVIVKGSGAVNLQVSLKDKNDYELYNEKQQNIEEGYAKKFDVEELPDGNYFLEIENDQKIEFYSLEIVGGELTIEHNRRLAIYKPRVVQKGNQVDIAMLKQPDIPLKLSILNNTNSIIYEDIVADTQSVNKRYDMSNLDPGSYTMKFSVAGRSFTKSIYIQ